jgi:uncharacterized membrane protein YedE/YeeE
MARNFFALVSGIVFGLGLSLSQMIDPNKVIGFLDITGLWDPSLVLVMLGALLVTLTGFRLVLKRSRPILETGFHVSQKARIDRPLLLGAAIFGIGWGMSGYCPGPAMVGMGLKITEAYLVVASIYAGFFAHKWISGFSKGI